MQGFPAVHRSGTPENQQGSDSLITHKCHLLPCHLWAVLLTAPKQPLYRSALAFCRLSSTSCRSHGVCMTAPAVYVSSLRDCCEAHTYFTWCLHTFTCIHTNLRFPSRRKLLCIAVWTQDRHWRQSIIKTMKWTQQSWINKSQLQEIWSAKRKCKPIASKLLSCWLLWQCHPGVICSAHDHVSILANHTNDWNTQMVTRTMLLCVLSACHTGATHLSS